MWRVGVICCDAEGCTELWRPDVERRAELSWFEGVLSWGVVPSSGGLVCCVLLCRGVEK